jgi:hypothetical protein
MICAQCGYDAEWLAYDGLCMWCHEFAAETAEGEGHG